MNTRLSLLLGLLLMGTVTPNFAGKMPCSPSDSVLVHDNGKRVELMSPVSLWWTALTGFAGLVLAAGARDAHAPGIVTAGVAVAPTAAFLYYRNYRNTSPYVTLDGDKIKVHNFLSQPYMHWGTYSSCTPLDKEMHNGMYVAGVPMTTTKEYLRVNGKDGSKVEIEVTGLGISRDQLTQLINYFVDQYNQQGNPVLLDDDDDDDVATTAKARKKKKNK